MYNLQKSVGFCMQVKALDGTEARKERQHVARNLFLIIDVQKTDAAEHISNYMQQTPWQTLRVKSQNYCQTCTLARNRAKPVIIS